MGEEKKLQIYGGISVSVLVQMKGCELVLFCVSIFFFFSSYIHVDFLKYWENYL